MKDCLIGLADRKNNFSYVRGSVVWRLQEKLHEAGHTIPVIDGVFGPGSSRAMAEWQGKNNRPVTGEVSPVEYEMLTGVMPSEFELALQLTARFEGHGFGLAMGNFDGAILTWGIIGFTMRFKTVHEVIRRIDAVDPNVVADAFGPLEDTFREGLDIIPTSPEAARWADDISEPGRPGVLKPQLRDAFARLGATRVAQEQQMALAREKYWSRAQSDAEKLGMTNRRGLALCFDIAVQCGGISDAEMAMIKSRQAAEAGTGQGAALRILVANVVADATGNARWIEDVRQRKLAIATGNGEVHGAKYRTRDWGLDNDRQQIAVKQGNAPAAEPPAPAIISKSHKDRFIAFFEALNLRHFRPDEFAFLGNRNKNPGDAAFNLNVLPPENLWHHMIPTAHILDRLRRDLNASIRLTNIYRSEAYNTAIGGAKNSQHMAFTAVDFFCKNGAGPESWGARLKEYRNEGAFRGGIGIYSDKFFVHLDTRGENVDFRP